MMPFSDENKDEQKGAHAMLFEFSLKVIYKCLMLWYSRPKWKIILLRLENTANSGCIRSFPG